MIKLATAFDHPIKTKSFIPPTREEIRLEAEEIGLTRHEADKFLYFYESKSWMVGKNPMKQWKSALQGWRLRWLERNGFVNIPKPQVVLPTRQLPPHEGRELTEQERKSYADGLAQLRKSL